MAFTDQQIGTARTRGQQESHEPNPFRVNYKRQTYPFPEGFFLRESLLQQIRRMVEEGRDIPTITGNDGDGKSTMLKQAARYFEWWGYPVLVVDWREARNLGGIQDAVDDFLKSETVKNAEARPVVCIDSADELWSTPDEKGKWWYSTLVSERSRLALQGQKLPPDLLEIYREIEDKLADMAYLQKIKPTTGLILTQHAIGSPPSDFYDIDLRRKAHELGIKGIDISGNYTKEEAMALLRHLGMTNEQLIGMLTTRFDSHGDLKKFACAIWKGKTMQERFEELRARDIDPTQWQHWPSSLHKWLDLINKAPGS